MEQLPARDHDAAGGSAPVQRVALITLAALLGALTLIAFAVILSRPLSPERSGPSPVANPSSSSSPGPDRSTGNVTPTDALPRGLAAVSSQTSVLAAAAHQLAIAQSAISPALEQVREASAQVIPPPVASAGGCATATMLYNDAMNAAVSLTSNTGAAVDNSVTSLRGSISGSMTAISAAAMLGVSATELKSARAAVAAADTEATQATVEQRSAEATAEILLTSAHARLTKCL